MASVSIADLTISIKDNSKQAAEKVLNLAAALEELRNKQAGSGALKTVANDIATLKSADMGGLVRLRKQLASATVYAERLATAMDKVVKASGSVKLGRISAQAAKQSQAVTSNSANMVSPTATEATGTTSSVDKALEKRLQAARATIQALEQQADLQRQMSGWIEESQRKYGASIPLSEKFKNAIVGVGQAGVSVFHKLLPQGMMRTLNQLGRLMKMRVLRTIVKSLLAGFTEGLQNCYYWAKATGDQFATSMDTISTSLNYAKNSIGAAFSNIINIIAPVIDQLVDWLVVGINYINMFFAALSGATEYTKAKKVAVEYGTAATGAIGGAAAAAKELKETLTVLDFDELHQLQEQQTPSSGGGGGGGGGTPAKDYADMFEKAKIDSWLLDNFQDILEIIEAIGAGILAWKLSDAFSNSIRELSGVQKLGFALTITGIVLEYNGAYGLGYNGFNTKDFVKTLIGSALEIGGLSMLTGSVATGFALGIPLALTVFITGYVKGKVDKNIELYQESDFYKELQGKIEQLARDKSFLIDLKAKLNSLSVESDERVLNVQVARNLLDEIAEWDGLKITPEVDVTELDTLIEMLNGLNLDGVVGQWDNVNGVIDINVEEIQKAIDKYDEYVRRLAAQELLVEAYKVQYQAEQKLSELQKQYGQENDNFNTMLDNYEYGMDFSTGYWQPGKPVSWITDIVNPEAAIEQRGINDQYAYLQDLSGQVEEAQGLVDESAEAINELRGMIGLDIFDSSNNSTEVVPPETTESIRKYKTELENLTPIEMRQYAAQLAMRHGYADLVPIIQQGGEQGRELTERLIDMYGEYKKGSSIVDDSTERVRTNTGVLKLAGDEAKNTSSTMIGAFNSIKAGVNMTAIGKTMADNLTGALQPVGSTIKTAIEKDMNSIGDGMKYSTVMSTINSGLITAQKATPFSNIGVSIGGNIQSGSTSGYSSNAVMTAYQNGLSGQQKKLQFTNIGTSIGGDIQTGSYDGFSSTYIMKSYESGLTKKQKAILFSAIGKLIGADMQNGTYNGFLSKYIMDAYQLGLKKAEYNAPFSSIGTAIAKDIKAGIAAAIKTISFSTTAIAAGVTKVVQGSATTSLYASGGYPEAGELFIMNEQTPEMLGTIGGRTAVANNQQIASAIAMALRPMLGGNGGTTTTNVNVNMDSKTVARASLKGQRAMNRQYNITANA